MAQNYDKPPPYSEVSGPNMKASMPPHMPSQVPPTYPINYQPAQNYGTTVVYPQPAIRDAQVIIIGGCPACRIGVLEDDFTCLGVLCAIFFFPIGILCCLAMRQRRCPNCAALFG